MAGQVPQSAPGTYGQVPYEWAAACLSRLPVRWQGAKDKGHGLSSESTCSWTYISAWRDEERWAGMVFLHTRHLYISSCQPSHFFGHHTCHKDSGIHTTQPFGQIHSHPSPLPFQKGEYSLFLFLTAAPDTVGRKQNEPIPSSQWPQTNSLRT